MAANRAMVVAIDGPAGAGKSTVARAVAQAVGYTLVDTGAIYRAVALLALRQQLDLQDEERLAALALAAEVHFDDGPGGEPRTLINGEDVTDLIRTAEVSRAVTIVSSHAPVRSALKAMQQALASRGQAVLEGRDIGTVICPDAPVKIFLEASLPERARRRHDELQARGGKDSLDEVQADMASRDARDSGRAVAPLRPAKDAIRLDCTRMTPEEVVETIVARVRQIEEARRQPHTLSAHAQAVWASSHRMGREPAAGLATTASAAEQRAQLEAFFLRALPARLAGESRLSSALSGTYLFVVTDLAEPMQWEVDCRPFPAKISSAAPEATAECTLVARAASLCDMVTGAVHPQLAFMRGELRVHGDLAMAMRLGALFA